MKRKAHAKRGGQGAGQVQYTRLTKSQKSRIRPAVSTDPGAALVDDPVALFFYALAIVVLFYIISKFFL